MEPIKKIDLRTIQLCNSRMDVVKLEEYSKHPDYYVTAKTAIEIPGVDYVLPIKSSIDIQRGNVGINIVPSSLFHIYNPPKDDEKDKYSSANIIDFGDISTMRELISTQEKVRDMEFECLTNSDNITVPKINDDDEETMLALKKAIISKQCDINLYKDRFNGTFSNDKREINRKSITLEKLKRFGNALDMKITLSITDTSADIANPMNSIITVDITGGDSDEVVNSVSKTSTINDDMEVYDGEDDEEV